MNGVDVIEIEPDEEAGPESSPPDLSPAAMHAHLVALQRGQNRIEGALDWVRDAIALQQLHVERIDGEHRYDRDEVRAMRERMDHLVGRDSGRLDLSEVRENAKQATQIIHLERQVAELKAAIDQQKAQKMADAEASVVRANRVAEDARAAMASSQHEIVVEERVAKRERSVWKERWFLTLLASLALLAAGVGGGIITAHYGGAPAPKHSAPALADEHP
jgi:hypothetical protein